MADKELPKLLRLWRVGDIAKLDPESASQMAANVMEGAMRNLTLMRSSDQGTTELEYQIREFRDWCNAKSITIPKRRR